MLFSTSKTFINSDDWLPRMVECPTCGAALTIAADAEKGELMTCADCGTELEVIDANTVKEAPQEEEDWGQ